MTRHYIFSYYRLATAIQAASSEESLQLLPGSISACPENTALNRSVAREKKKKKASATLTFRAKMNADSFIGLEYEFDHLWFYI